jgi:hypothetical protein
MLITALPPNLVDHGSTCWCRGQTSDTVQCRGAGYALVASVHRHTMNIPGGTVKVRWLILLAALLVPLLSPLAPASASTSDAFHWKIGGEYGWFYSGPQKAMHVFVSTYDGADGQQSFYYKIVKAGCRFTSGNATSAKGEMFSFSPQYKAHSRETTSTRTRGPRRVVAKPGTAITIRESTSTRTAPRFSR